MNSIGGWLRAIALAVSTVICPQESIAQGLTGTQFAGWPVDSQDSYIQTSVTMAGVVITQVNPAVSRCIDDWYVGGGRRSERDAAIREIIRTHPNYHPSGTILAVLMDACGPLN